MPVACECLVHYSFCRSRRHHISMPVHCAGTLAQHCSHRLLCHFCLILTSQSIRTMELAHARYVYGEPACGPAPGTAVPPWGWHPHSPRPQATRSCGGGGGEARGAVCALPPGVLCAGGGRGRHVLGGIVCWGGGVPEGGVFWAGAKSPFGRFLVVGRFPCPWACFGAVGCALVLAAASWRWSVCFRAVGSVAVLLGCFGALCCALASGGRVRMAIGTSGRAYMFALWRGYSSTCGYGGGGRWSGHRVGGRGRVHKWHEMGSHAHIATVTMPPF